MVGATIYSDTGVTTSLRSVEQKTVELDAAGSLCR